MSADLNVMYKIAADIEALDNATAKAAESTAHLHAMADGVLINAIERIRSQNNTRWMDLLRLAFELDPARARVIMRGIVEGDAEVQRLTKELAHNE